MSSFLANSSYSFHQIGLKLFGGQLDHEVVQHILFRGHNTPKFDVFCKDFPDMT